jgi:hypothetical protein
MRSEKGCVYFGITNGELCAYTWNCRGEGRLFLKELERYAEKHNLKLTVPTVLSYRLQRILEENGYSMNEVPYLDDICELWSKG